MSAVLTRSELEDFLFLEAALLDNWQLDEWLALFDLVPFAAFPLDTGLAAMTLIRAGVLERHPLLRIGFSHGGGAVVPLTHRLKQGWLSSDGFNGLLSHAPQHYAAQCFYDSLVYDVDYLDYFATRFAPGQVFAGTDYPYAIAQQDVVGFLTGSAHCAVNTANDAARRFLGIDNNSNAVVADHIS